MKNGAMNRNGSNGAKSKPRSVPRIEMPIEESRLPVLKTYKIYIGGKFPRTESGRFYQVKNPKTGAPLANVCLSSRKDFRAAVIASPKCSKAARLSSSTRCCSKGTPIAMRK